MMYSPDSQARPELCSSSYSTKQLRSLHAMLQALKAAEEAEKEWEADSPQARKEALSNAQNAADFAQQTYKHLRLVHN